MSRSRRADETCPIVCVAKRRPPPGLSRIWRAISNWPRAQPTIESPGCVSSFLGGRTSMRNLFSAKRGERFAREPVDGPLGVGPGSQPLIESDRLTVPVEHLPLEPSTPALDRQTAQLLDQCTSDAMSPPFPPP